MFCCWLVDQEPSGTDVVAGKLQSLAAVFSREGAERLREELQSMGMDCLRKASAAAGLPLRAGGKSLPAFDLRSALLTLLAHVTSASGADGQEQA